MPTIIIRQELPDVSSSEEESPLTKIEEYLKFSGISARYNTEIKLLG